MARILFALGLTGLLLATGLGSAEPDKDPPKKGKEGKDKAQVVEVDLSKLPPELAKQVRAALEARPAVKAISLAQAVTIAEKLNKGSTATKAERKDKPEVFFKIEVVGADGEKKKVELTADGKPRDQAAEAPAPRTAPATAPAPPAPPPPKAKGKGKDGAD